jgi:ubiquinone/menaquinone biosynthesis C-methylase UbiE
MSIERELRLGAGRRAFAWVAFGLLGVGVFWPPLGAWTSPILGAGFMSAQKPLGGLARLAAIQLGLSVVSGLFDGWPPRWETIPDTAAALALGLVSPLAYRLFSPRARPGLAGLALPAFAVTLVWVLGHWVPARSLAMIIPAPGRYAPFYLSHAIAGLMLWGWIGEWRGGFWTRASLAGAGLAIPPLADRLAPGALGGLGLAGPPTPPLVLACLALAAGVTAFALLTRPFAAALAPSEADLDFLRAPGGGARPRLAGGDLVGEDGRVYPVRHGVAHFEGAGDLTGQNGKLSGLYRNLAGFYDDIQRIYSALLGLDRAAYMRNYLRDLAPRPGDRVLETSIGTGLSFKVLPRDIEIFGVDLSTDMLDVCRANFSRWRRPARLYAANAQALPFADESFDTVFHVGGINFFDDKAAAIAEMIRVARPGARILIADETEKHVKAVYEAAPGARGYFQDRAGPVAAPLALLPAGLGRVSFRTLMNDQFYVISFVKPGEARSPTAPAG